MRVRHLTDIEIQALMDRRTISAPEAVPLERYRKDLDAQEHLDNCPHCRAELESYRALYGELERSTIVALPKNFARKVTFSLPPFRAHRTRARLQLVGVWGFSLLVSLVWLVSQMSLAIPLTRLLGAVQSFFQQAALIREVVVGLIPAPEVAYASFMARMADVIGAIEHAFLGDLATASLVMFAGLVVLMIVWVDSYFAATVRQKQ